MSQRFILLLLGSLFILGACSHHHSAPGHDPHGPGNSEHAPGHDPHGPGNSEHAPGHR